MIGRVPNYLWYWITGLLIWCVKILSLSAMICSVLILIFIFAAQLTRYGRSGEWHPVPISELLEILKVEMPPTEVFDFPKIVGVLLDFPATLTLFLAAIILYCVKKLLERAEDWRRRHNPRNASRHDAMIKAIEQALGDLNR